MRMSKEDFMRIAAYDPAARKRPTNVSLNEDLLAKVKGRFPELQRDP